MHSLARKGMGIEAVVSIALIIAAAIGLFFLVKNVGNNVGDATGIEACKISVLQKAKATIAGHDLLNIKLKCPTEKVNVLAKGDKKIESERNIFVEDQKDVQQVIANEMFDCWYKFGNGEVDFIRSKDVLEKRICYICSDIIFGENVIKNTKIGSKINNFEKYLVETKVPGRDLSYYEYFGGNVEFTKMQDAVINLDISKRQAVIYTVVAENVLVELLKSISAGIGTAGIIGGSAAFIGATPPGWVISVPAVGVLLISGGGKLLIEGQPARAIMQVVPLEDASNKCDAL